jgi:hypothetical protein
VIDNVSTLFATAFPKAIDNFDNNRNKKPDAVQWASSRRWALMGDFTAMLSKLATINNTAVLLLGQTSTKVRTEHGALLKPALSTKSWLENVHTRLVIFRDFLSASTDHSPEHSGDESARIVGLVKHAGVLYASLDKVIPFKIDKVCGFACLVTSCS